MGVAVAAAVGVLVGVDAGVSVGVCVGVGVFVPVAVGVGVGVDAAVIVNPSSTAQDIVFGLITTTSYAPGASPATNVPAMCSESRCSTSTSSHVPIMGRAPGLKSWPVMTIRLLAPSGAESGATPRTLGGGAVSALQGTGARAVGAATAGRWNDIALSRAPVDPLDTTGK